MPDVKLNHLAVVVENLDNAMTFWRDALGLELDKIEEVDAEAVKVAFFEAGESHVELVQPTTDDSGIAKYLAKKGAGMHHVCFEVDNIETAMQQMRDNGIELINETPRTAEGRIYAFVHPKSTGGVLVELYQLA